MEQIFEGFKRVFKTENAMVKHLTLAGLCGIMAVPVSYYYMKEDAIKAALKASQSISELLPGIWTILGWTALILI
ncbi:MAG: hypothetical protein LBJ74_01040, partial [Heliobacteriaceae bacterium]|nr:hypothetical protein [Heliobacteriaceae bacterium]